MVTGAMAGVNTVQDVVGNLIDTALAAWYTLFREQAAIACSPSPDFCPVPIYCRPSGRLFDFYNGEKM